MKTAQVRRRGEPGNPPGASLFIEDSPQDPHSHTMKLTSLFSTLAGLLGLALSATTAIAQTPLT